MTASPFRNIHAAIDCGIKILPPTEPSARRRMSNASQSCRNPVWIPCCLWLLDIIGKILEFAGTTCGGQLRGPSPFKTKGDRMDGFPDVPRERVERPIFAEPDDEADVVDAQQKIRKLIVGSL